MDSAGAAPFSPAAVLAAVQAAGLSTNPSPAAQSPAASQSRPRLRFCLPRAGLFWIEEAEPKHALLTQPTVTSLMQSLTAVYPGLRQENMDRELARLFTLALDKVNDMASFAPADWWDLVVQDEPASSWFRRITKPAIMETFAKTILARQYVTDKAAKYDFAAVRSAPCKTALAVDKFVAAVRDTHYGNAVVVRNFLGRFEYEEEVLKKYTDPNTPAKTTFKLKLIVREFVVAAGGPDDFKMGATDDELARQFDVYMTADLFHIHAGRIGDEMEDYAPDPPANDEDEEMPDAPAADDDEDDDGEDDDEEDDDEEDDDDEDDDDEGGPASAWNYQASSAPPAPVNSALPQQQQQPTSGQVAHGLSAQPAPAQHTTSQPLQQQQTPSPAEPGSWSVDTQPTPAQQQQTSSPAGPASWYIDTTPASAQQQQQQTSSPAPGTWYVDTTPAPSHGRGLPPQLSASLKRRLEEDEDDEEPSSSQRRRPNTPPPSAEESSGSDSNSNSDSDSDNSDDTIVVVNEEDDADDADDEDEDDDEEDDDEDDDDDKPKKDKGKGKQEGPYDDEPEADDGRAGLPRKADGTLTDEAFTALARDDPAAFDRELSWLFNRASLEVDEDEEEEEDDDEEEEEEADDWKHA